MSKIDDIIDRLVKGGAGSGRRGHKTLAPVSDTKREFDPSKKKKILASDKRAAKKEVKGHSPKELQSAIDKHKELSESQFLSPASRESYAAKHKSLVAHQKKQVKAAHPGEMESAMAEYKKQNPVEAAGLPGPFGGVKKGKEELEKVSASGKMWGGGGGGSGGPRVTLSSVGIKSEKEENDLEKKVEKGGPGSGKKGHMGVTPDRKQRESNRQKAGDALQTSKDAKRIIAELDLGKEDLKDIRDYASAEGITPSQFIVNNKKHIMTNLKKGGPGSGRKGHKTSGKIEPKHFEPNPNLRDKNKDLDRLTPEQSEERKKKKEEAKAQAKKERLKERADAAYKRGDHKEYEKLISQVRKVNPYKGNPASEGASASRSEAYDDSPAAQGERAARGDANKKKMDAVDEAHEMMSSLIPPGMEKALDKSLDTLFYMNQLANQGRINPKNKRSRVRKSGKEELRERLEKKQGVPKGVDPAKHERCVMDVKSQGNDKSSAFAICNSSMKKGGPGSGQKGHVEETDLDQVYGDTGSQDKTKGDESKLDLKQMRGGVPSMHERRKMKNKKLEKLAPLAIPAIKTAAKVIGRAVKPTEAGAGSDQVPTPTTGGSTNQASGVGPSAPKITKSKEKVEKVLPLAVAAKTAGRIVNNAVKSPDAGKGSDKVPGGPGGPSAAAGGGTGQGIGSSKPSISKSLAQRLDEMIKGGIGSGKKGHHTFTGDGYEHDSVFEDSPYDNTGEREAFRDKMLDAVKRNEEAALQRIKEKEGKRDSTSSVSRKGGKKPESKTFLQRMGQKIIDSI